MKTMHCHQLGGPSTCKVSFSADSWDQIKAMSHKHGQDMHAKGEPDHLKAMQDMQKMMSNPDKIQKWMDQKEAEFNQLPND